MMIYYLVYQLTNLVNGKIYVGCHMTKNLNDGYMGSGRRIGYAKKKYGIENFKKEILSVHETPEEMLAEEAQIVNEAFIRRADVYNLACGGRGSWVYVNATYPKDKRVRSTSKAGKASAIAHKNNPDLANKHYTKNSIAMKEAWIKGIFTVERAKLAIQKATAVAATKEVNEKRKATLKANKHQQGEKNTNYGKVWIFNERESKPVKKESLELWLALGWKKGRRMFTSR